jgi:hypothetical protein
VAAEERGGIVRRHDRVDYRGIGSVTGPSATGAPEGTGRLPNCKGVPLLWVHKHTRSVTITAAAVDNLLLKSTRTSRSVKESGEGGGGSK